MIYIPNRNNKALNIACVLLIIGVIVFGLSNFAHYPAVFQLLSLVAIVAGTQLLVRFVLCEYRYIIDDREDGNSSLVVIRKQGAREVKVCHISLSSVTAVGDDAICLVTCDARYNYCRNICAKGFDVCFSDGAKTSCVKLEADEAFLDALRKRCVGDAGFDDITFAM